MAEAKKIAIKKPPIRFQETQRVVERIGKRLGGPFIAYWNNPRGAVCHNDVVALYRLLEQLGKSRRVYLFVKSSGGNGQASLRFVSLLREYFKEVHALVPLEAESAATMIALGANAIHMGPMSYLTAVDTSLTHDLSPIDRDNERVSVSLDELKRVIRLWQQEKDQTASNPYKSLFEYVHPLVIGAVDRADSLSIKLCKEILSYHVKDRQKIERIATTLNSKYPSHGYPIHSREARSLGLRIDELDHGLLDLLLELNELYSEMGQKSTTDFDETHSHTNEVLNILEARGAMVYYQMEKDWFYRTEERRWVTMNDKSGWQRMVRSKGKVVQERFHIL
ncbi:MAG: hypothetical protein M5U26_00605 [Planctomycetota bacterium]|nr:hypothetical protein [Planctomycetota bacterium]